MKFKPTYWLSMKNFLCVLLILAALDLFAQGNTISGYVKDASNGETLIGASVVVKGTSQGVITNVYGFYSLTLPPGDYTLEYRYIGYATKIMEVNLTYDQRMEI